MRYNHYNYLVYLEADNNYTLEGIRQVLPAFLVSENTKSSLTLSFKGWKFCIELVSGTVVRAEAQEIQNWLDKPEILNCNSRLELYAEEDPEREHFNDHLFVLKILSKLEGAYIYDPVMLEFLFQETERGTVDMEFLESLDNDKIKFLIQKLQVDSQKWETWNDLGFCYNRLNRQDLRVKCYENSLLIHPENSPAHFNIGQYYKDLKQYDIAKVHFLKAIELEPDKSEYLTELGGLYAAEKNKEKAFEYLELAIEKDPENGFCNTNYGYFLLVYGEAARAMLHIEKAILLGDTDVAFFNKAHVLLVTRRRGSKCFLRRWATAILARWSRKLVSSGPAIPAVTGSEELAVRFYAMSLNNYPSENEFWEDYDADFSIMLQYGISSEYYQGLKEKIKAENIHPTLN